MEYDVEARLASPKKYNRRTDLISNITSERKSKFCIFRSDFLTQSQCRKVRVCEQNQQITQDMDMISYNKHWQRLYQQENRPVQTSARAGAEQRRRPQRVKALRILHEPFADSAAVEYVRGQKRYRLSPVLARVPMLLM